MAGCKGNFAFVAAACLAGAVRNCCLPMILLPTTAWRECAAAHRARAERHTLPVRKRRDTGVAHPVEDFLFQYYPYPMVLLERWQPGCGVGLEWDSPTLPADFTGRSYSWAEGWISLGPEKMAAKERDRLRWIRELLVATAERPPNFGCHGLHEWAMVYQGSTVRHEKTARLRLPQGEIDALVESRAVCCSHHDAFRFFAAAARPMNRLQPSLEGRLSMEQPGCVHANMDLYKWAAKAMPWVGSELLLDCFELAMALRDLDMRASPYDLAAWGCKPIHIETAEGRTVYELEQRRLAVAAVPLRDRLISGLEKALG